MTKGERSLPKGWRWARLGEVADYINGRAFKPKDWETSGIPIIRIQNLTSNEAPFNYFTREVEEKYKVNDSDLLISWSASLDAFIWKRGPAILNQHIFKTVEHPGIITRQYLYFAAREAMDEIRAQVHGATMRHITKPEFESIKIPLPPLSEQQLIAAILNEQMAAVEKARAAAEAQLEIVHTLPAAYLREVFESEEARGWRQVKLGDISTLIQNGIYKSAENYGYGHPFLRMYNIANDSWKLNLEPLAQVNLKDTELESFRLRAGDLLVSRVNSFELVGKCGWAEPEVENYVFENMLIRVRLTDAANSLFVAQQMRTRIIREQIEAVAKRAIGQSSINSTDLRGIQIYLPSLAIQENVAKSLTEKILTARKTRRVLETQLTAIEQLPVALLRRAFSGELHQELSIVSSKTLPLDIHLRQQAAIMIFNIKQMYGHPTFGHVKCEKMQFMAEAHVGLELGGHYRRAQFGPYDKETLDALEPLAEQQDWFRVIKPSDDKKKYSYELGTAAEELLQTSEAILGNHKSEMERVLKLFKPFHTRRVEMLVTLFAAWNDLLIEGYVPIDAQIISEVRENWHVSKQSFTPQRLQVGLDWLRQNRLIPQGRGPRTSPNIGDSHG